MYRFILNLDLNNIKYQILIIYNVQKDFPYIQSLKILLLNTILYITFFFRAKHQISV